jgi:hypothetical protein
MTTTLSGPMFERAKNGPWESVHRKDGGHYNNYGCRDDDGMKALREFFPTATANKYNVCLFSTSGIHGMYTTIEEAEANWKRGNKYEDGEDCTPQVTFLIVQPRICTVRHGNCNPESQEDFDFLKKLRQSSWDELQKIGRPD